MSFQQSTYLSLQDKNFNVINETLKYFWDFHVFSCFFMFQHAQDSLKCYYDQKITSFFPSDFKSVFVWHLTPQNLRLRIFKCKFRISRSTIFHIQNYNKASSTVAHTGKTQLNSRSETQQSFEEHNNLFENTTIFSRTQQSIREHNCCVSLNLVVF